MKWRLIKLRGIYAAETGKSADRERRSLGTNVRAVAVPMLADLNAGRDVDPARIWRKRVYFIQCNGPGGPIKIGIAADPKKRLLAIASAMPFPVRLLKSAPGTEADERAVHRIFRESRLVGEWFRETQELLAYIKLIVGNSAPWHMGTPRPGTKSEGPAILASIPLE